MKEEEEFYKFLPANTADRLCELRYSLAEEEEEEFYKLQNVIHDGMT